MMLSDDARMLWDAAQSLKAEALARDIPPVSPRRRDLPALLFFTDPQRTPRPWETAARLPAGTGVVFRHFGAEDAEVAALRLRQITSERGLILLIGLDADLAQRVAADGVHLPERALSAAYALSGKHPDWLITGAVHSVEAAKAVRDLDAVILSPVFPAGGTSASRTALGVEALSSAARDARCPVYALGGIGPKSAGRLAGSGACGIAGVEAVASAFGDSRT